MPNARLSPFTSSLIIQTNMLAAFRLLLHPSYHHQFLRPAALPCPSAISAVRLRQTKSLSSKGRPDDQERECNMGQKENPAPPRKTSTIDPMSNSFGEGYATRSDEEGFGGIYGGNQSLRPEECDKGSAVHEKNHSDDYDKTQGSEVKEKEKGRNLPHGHHVG